MRILTALALMAAAQAVAEPAKDAAGLDFSSYMVKAQVVGPFASVSSLMRWRNLGTRPLAGDAALPVPDGAAVAGVASDESGAMSEIDVRYSGRVENAVLRLPFATIPGGGRRAMRVDSLVMLGHDAKLNGRSLNLPTPRTKLGECAVSVAVDGAAGEPTLDGMVKRKFAEADGTWRAVAMTFGKAPEDVVRVAVPVSSNAVVALETDGTSTWFVVDAPAPAPPPWKPVTSANAFRILWDASAKRGGENLRRAVDAVGILPRSTYYSLVVFRDKPEPERFFSSRAELVAALDKVKYAGESDLGALAEAVAPLAVGERITTLLFTGGGGRKSELDVAFGRHRPLALVSGAVPDMPALQSACLGRVMDLAHVTLEEVAAEILHPAQRLIGVRGDGVADVQGLGASAEGRVVVLGRLAQSEAVICLDFGDERLSDLVTLRESDAKPGSVLAAAHRLGLANPFLK